MRHRGIFVLGLVVAASLASARANAAPVPPGFDKANFDKLVATAAEKGDLLDTGEGYQFKVLKHIVPNIPHQSHRADYFSGEGVTTSSGEFRVFRVSVEAEDWRRRPDGDMEIEEWNFTSNLNGGLLGISHSLVVEDDSGTVKEIKSLPNGGVNDPAAVARWGAKLIEWGSF